MLEAKVYETMGIGMGEFYEIYLDGIMIGFCKDENSIYGIVDSWKKSLEEVK